jgi:ATP-dependent RNA helicase MSS116
MHSELGKSRRQVISDRFREARQAVMFSSDLSARGMDNPNGMHVIQMGLP